MEMSGLYALLVSALHLRVRVRAISVIGLSCRRVR